MGKKSQHFKVVRADGDWYVIPSDHSEPQEGQLARFDTRAEAEAACKRRNGQ